MSGGTTMSVRIARKRRRQIGRVSIADVLEVFMVRE